ncbi:hypothetical protein BST97_06800 [Nonlabens spongiae]|uniref:DUF2254 domain-containing protein n=1 Tax=Nonlabens spongiae TaxID=331648 RepID=A0A1W6MJD8_9FLAO|nr:DUF2254 family protein [Nonlabens spongiae]ARN77728.1 hypothetical protein BST97_06800 [Nonlabens spongiae]
MLVYLKRLYKSIALLPSIIALCFVVLAILMNLIEIDYAEYSLTDALAVSDKKDSQYIFSFIIGGIFTLTIFSYTMVMNVLNRNINNYSPRLIPLILSERHHQLILGFTSGTILYSMVMSLSLTNDNGGYFPTVASGLGIIFAMACVLLFIYFIHSVSQSIHINYIIDEVYEKANKDLEKFKSKEEFFSNYEGEDLYHEIVNSGSCGYLHDFNVSELYKDAKKMDVSIQIVKFKGAFILENEVFLKSSRELSEEEIEKIKDHFVIDHTVCSDVFETNVKHLVEVGVKACSPAINDPGTALNAVDFLQQLMINRFKFEDYNVYSEGIENQIIVFNTIERKNLFETVYHEMYYYMKDDPVLNQVLKSHVSHLRTLFPELSFIRIPVNI